MGGNGGAVWLVVGGWVSGRLSLWGLSCGKGWVVLPVLWFGVWSYGLVWCGGGGR